MQSAADDPVLESLRYPVGRFEPQDAYTAADTAENLQRLAMAPKRLSVAVRGLAAAQLDTAYRPGGWSARQVVHHLADSALNGSARFRWALTEDEPTIKPYDENRWAELADSKRGSIEPSRYIVEGVTERLVVLLKTLTPKDWARRFYHPESKEHLRLDLHLAKLAWHHEHHVAHISSLRARAGWKE